jgi:tRNA threonylcarbamoyladenosine biosynthesis protein TsaE
VICLSGDLGAGKTALTSGIGKGWGAREPVNSPTFVFVHEHRRLKDNLRLFHVDCYRLSSLEDAETVGIEEILAGDDVVVIEWPERIETLLPVERLWITLDMVGETTEGTERQISFQATGARYTALLDCLRVD